MKIPFEEHSEKFANVIAEMLKLAIFLGGACVVAYSLRIGRFPQGLTIGDSLLLVMAAICFGAVASLFVFSLVSLGIMLSPMVRFSFWITGKIIPKFANAIKKSPYMLAPLSWFAAIGALFAVLIIVRLAHRDIMLDWNLPLLSIALYFVYSVSVSSHKQLVELGSARRVDARNENPYRVTDGLYQATLRILDAEGADIRHGPSANGLRGLQRRYCFIPRIWYRHRTCVQGWVATTHVGHP